MKRFQFLATAILSGLLFSSNEAMAQESTPATHTIFMAVVEIKGGTSVEKFAPAPVNLKALSKGYDLKTRSEADKRDPKRWEVSSYMFSPSSVTLRQGDTVKLTAIVVDADEHHVRLNDPDGREVIAETKWNYGREHRLSFVANPLGPYNRTRSDHAPTMTATFLVFPRK